MKELLDEINELRMIYPEHDAWLDDILDVALQTLEEGYTKEEAIRNARVAIREVRSRDL